MKKQQQTLVCVHGAVYVLRCSAAVVTDIVVVAFLFDSALAHAVPKCMRFANDLRIFSVVFRY